MTNRMINHIEVKNHSNNMVNCYLNGEKTQVSLSRIRIGINGSKTEIISDKSIYRQMRKHCGRNTALITKSLFDTTTWL